MTSIKPPPVLPDIEDELSNYLLCPENLPIHKYERNQECWSRSSNPQTLFSYNLSPISSTLQVRTQDLTLYKVLIGNLLGTERHGHWANYRFS